MSQTLFAHVGTTHVMEDGSTMSALEHCAPIFIGAGVIIVVLFAIICYFLMAWEPKKSAKKIVKKTR